MGNKRYILSFLLFISIIMLTAPIISHHHHANGVICMKSDMTLEPQCPRHRYHPGNDSCCNDGRMTRLDSPTPSVQAGNSPYYLLIVILFTDPIIENLFRPRERCIKNYYAYQESFHSTVINCAFGFRTPPCPVVQIYEPYFVRLGIY